MVFLAALLKHSSSDHTKFILLKLATSNHPPTCLKQIHRLSHTSPLKFKSGMDYCSTMSPVFARPQFHDVKIIPEQMIPLHFPVLYNFGYFSKQ